ncbi:MAG: glycoside hydrolase family 9 protein [Verrucomicrobiota bacterium]
MLRSPLSAATILGIAPFFCPLSAAPLSPDPVGHMELRILSEDFLELHLVNQESGGQWLPAEWDFGQTDGSAQLPLAGDFSVVANGAAVTVEAVGFRRRALYAPHGIDDLRVGNWLTLKLAQSLPAGAQVEVSHPDATRFPPALDFSATMEADRISSAIHVNQVGFPMSGPKQAVVGDYLGSLGELPIGPRPFWLVDEHDVTVFSGTLTAKPDLFFAIVPTPYQEVFVADFSAFATPGTYQVEVPGLGRSLPFLIGDETAARIARAYALGLYHQRSGVAKDLPVTRFTHGADHTAPALIPDDSHPTNAFLPGGNWDVVNDPEHTAPQLDVMSASLYPFVNTGTVEVAGGHHDAGDYSKYTINSAQLIHVLVFAVDHFPGVVGLDNLGLPESGDGLSDLLQEAKWEADFLLKMQDADGGFYFLVYPEFRKYEHDVLPDDGDPQVVWPKNTAVTAAAVAALAQAGSSPAMQQAFPAEAAAYLAAALDGWQFLLNAVATHGKQGAYQKITHYGHIFRHDDELAWAASEVFLATGDAVAHDKLREWMPDPGADATRRWGWWRLFEGWGGAIRSYAFGTNGRRTLAEMDAAFLAACQAEVVATGQDKALWSQEMAYGSSYPYASKRINTAGWYFSASQGFDLVTAELLQADPDQLEAIETNLNYELGANPNDQSFVAGLGWNRPTEWVHQYAQNDRGTLPPSGIVMGSLQEGFTWYDPYTNRLSEPNWPVDWDSGHARYPLYDRWGDTYNVTTEMVSVDIGKSLAVAAWRMASTSLATQPWVPTAMDILGLPGQLNWGDAYTLTVSSPGLDLSQAEIVWESDSGPPFRGSQFSQTVGYGSASWVEAEATLPDGRRLFAALDLPTVNEPPVPEAGPDVTFAWPDTAWEVVGSVSDDGLPSGAGLVVLWELVSGPGAVEFLSPGATSTWVHFSDPGTYLLRLSVSDGQFLRSDEVAITATANPEGTLRQSVPPPAAPEQVVARYDFADGPIDLSGQGQDLALSGGAALAQLPDGRRVLQVGALGDEAQVQLADSLVLPTGTEALEMRFVFRPQAWLQGGVTNKALLSLEQSWDTSLKLHGDKWAGERIYAGSHELLTSAQLGSALPLGQWHEVVLSYGLTEGVAAEINGVVEGQNAGGLNEGRSNDWTLVLGNFSGEIDELEVVRTDASGVAAYYSFEEDLSDASGNALDLTLQGGAQQVASIENWKPTDGGVLRFQGLGDAAQVSIPDSLLLPGSGQALRLSVWMRVRGFLQGGQTSTPLLSLEQSWDTSLKLHGDKWAGERVYAGSNELVESALLQGHLRPGQWHHLEIAYDGGSLLSCHLDGQLLASQTGTLNVGRSNDWSLILGHFDGDIGQVVLHRD